MEARTCISPWKRALLCSPAWLPFFRSIYMQKRPLFLRSCCSCSFPSEEEANQEHSEEQRPCFHRKALGNKGGEGKVCAEKLSSSEMPLSTGSS